MPGRWREILQPLTDADLSTAAFPFFRSQQITVAGVECTALRVSFTGDLGWELHCDTADQIRLYSALLDVARAHGGGPVGSRALGSLRIEKGYGSWSRDYSPEYWPQECGLDGLIRMDKDFLNKSACARVLQQPARQVLRAIEVVDTEVDATGNEPIFDLVSQPTGKVSSASYGYHLGASLALAYLRPDITPGTELSVMILGLPHKARVLPGPAFDARGTRLRS